MDQAPLVTNEIDAGTRFLIELEKYIPIRAAFWVRERDSEERSLYVASEQITDDNFDVAYGEVLRIAKALRDPYFDLFQVKLVSVDDPLAKAALEVKRRFPPGPVPTRFGGEVFGGLPVEEVYIYPDRLTSPPS